MSAWMGPFNLDTPAAVIEAAIEHLVARALDDVRAKMPADLTDRERAIVLRDVERLAREQNRLAFASGLKRLAH